MDFQPLRRYADAIGRWTGGLRRWRTRGFYDPDFCIYNDVVVFTPSNDIEIYGYPAEVLPPTDFHSATLVQNQLFLIGSLGYQNARRIGETPVYVVDLSEYRISKMHTFGQAPGWIHGHAADCDSTGILTVHGGRIVCGQNARQVFQRNFDDYSLNTGSGEWRRVSDRKWHQFNVRQEDRQLFALERRPEIEALLPDGAKVLGEARFDPEFTRIDVGGVAIALSVGVRDIEIIVEADLPKTLLSEIAEHILVKTEAAVGRKCVLEKIGD